MVWETPGRTCFPMWEWGGRRPCWGTYQGAGGPRRSERIPRAVGQRSPSPPRCLMSPGQGHTDFQSPTCSQKPHPWYSLPFHCPARKQKLTPPSSVLRRFLLYFGLPRGSFLSPSWVRSGLEPRSREADMLGGLAVPLGEGLPAASTARALGTGPGR